MHCTRALFFVGLLTVNSTALADESLLGIPTYCARVAALRPKTEKLESEAKLESLRAALPGVRQEWKALSDTRYTLSLRLRQFGVPRDGSLDSVRDQQQAEYRAEVPNFDGLAAQFQAPACDLEPVGQRLPVLIHMQEQLKDEEKKQLALEKLSAEKFAQAAAPVAADASFADRQLSFDGVSSVDRPRLFQTAAKERFIYLRKPMGRGVPRGEAVLIIGLGYDKNLRAITVDGQELDGSFLDFSPTPIKGAPPVGLKAERLTVTGPNGAKGGYDELNMVVTDVTALNGPPEFLLFASGLPEVDDFLSLREKTLACYTSAMKKLDPDNVRSHYDVVQGSRVEYLADKYDRQVCGKCDCKGLNMKQRALAKKVLPPLQDEQVKAYGPTLERLRSLFP